MEHETETQEEFQLAVGSGNNHRIYRAKESFVPDQVLDDENPIYTCNYGTEEYDNMGMEALMEELNLAAFVDKHYTSANSNCQRANFQKHFAIAGAQNVGPPVGADKTILHYGSTIPRLNANTVDREGNLETEVALCMSVATRVARKMRVGFCEDGYLETDSNCKETFAFIDEELGKGMSRFAAFSLALLPLDGKARVKRHQDLDNDPNLSATLNISEILFMRGQWIRASLIFYQRKSVGDMLVRRAACKEGANHCKDFMDKIKTKEPYRMPFCPIATYFDEGVGSEGLLVTVDNTTNKVINLALKSKPSADKQSTFLSPVAFAILYLMQFQKMELGMEFVQLVAVVGHLCGIYVFVTVLCLMQDDWDREESSRMPGGLVQYTFQRIIEITGCVSGGPGRRCMNFLNKDMPVKDVVSNCQHLWSMASSWLGGSVLETSESTSKAQRGSFEAAVSCLVKKAKWMGCFSAQHVIHVLALLSVAPLFFLDYAVISASEIRARKSNRNPAMQEYVDRSVAEENKEASSNNESNRRGKFSVVLASVARFLRAYYGLPHLTESTVENILCEAQRGESPACDLWFPGHGWYRKEEHEDGTYQWYRVTPTLCSNASPEIGQDVESSLKMMVRFRQEPLVSPRHCMPLTPRVGGFQERQGGDCAGSKAIETKISIGRKDDKSSRYSEYSIGHSEIARFPGLMECLKLAMVCRPNSQNRHSDFMKRLNGIGALKALIQSHASGSTTSSKKAKRKVPLGKPPSEGVPFAKSLPEQPSNKRKKKKKRKVENHERREFSALPRDGSWQKASWRVHEGIKYRVYSKQQAEGTILDDGCMGFQIASDFNNTPCKQWLVSPSNDAHAAMTSGRSSDQHELPRPKLAVSKRKRSGGAQNITTEKTFFVSKRVEKQVHHASFRHLPDDCVGVASQCELQDRLAMVLGGVKIAVGREISKGRIQHRWFFCSKDVAVNCLLMSIVCACGMPKFFDNLRRRVVKDAQQLTLGGNAPVSSAASSAAICIGYSGAGTAGTMKYYLITERAPVDNNKPCLVIAFLPSNTSNTRKPLFIRLQ